MPARAGRSDHHKGRWLAGLTNGWSTAELRPSRHKLAWFFSTMFLAVVVPASAANTTAKPAEQPLAPAIAPYQQLPRLNQAPAQHGGPTLLLLFGADCRFCKQQARLMASLKTKCPQAQMALVGVQGERTELLQDLRQLQTPLPAFLASPAFLRAIDGVQAVPTSLLLNRDGTLLLKHRGMLDAAQMQLINQQLLAPGCPD